MSNIHEKLERLRPRRSRMSYGLDSPQGGVGDRHELPFVVGVLGDFSGLPTKPPTPLKDREFIQIDRENFHGVVKGMTPGLNFRVENTLDADGSELMVRLDFGSLADFEPSRVAGQVPALAYLLAQRDALRDLAAWVDLSDTLEDLLERLFAEPRELERLKDELHGGEGPTIDGLLAGFPPHADRPRVLVMLAALVRASASRPEPGRGIVPMIRAGLGAIDATLSKQLAAIMHHPDFLRLEGSWRGLHYLVSNSETSSALKIRVLNVSKKELFRSFDRAVRFDEEAMYRKVHLGALDAPGGEPFAALVGDYEMTNHPDDVTLLGKMSLLAAACFCPFIAAAGPGLFGFKRWDEMTEVSYLEKILAGPDHVKWRSFRESEDSRFVTLVLPRVLARLPYGRDTRPVDEFDFAEAGPEAPLLHDHHVWMNAAYVLGARLTQAFALTGFCAAIRGREGGGLVDDLPRATFLSDFGEPTLNCPTEFAVTDRRENELSTLGLLPLCALDNTGGAAFFGAQTCHKPQKYPRHPPTEDAAIASRLPCVMVTARFMHHAHVVARARPKPFSSPEDLAGWLNDWLQGSVNASPDLDPALRWQYPLISAGVQVRAAAGESGAWLAEVRLWPRLPMEDLHGPVTLRTLLPVRA